MTIPTNLYHYSKDKVDNLVAEFYEKFKDYWPEEGSMKPCGLWISVEDNPDDYNWYDWCKDVQFRLEYLRHCYAVKLAEDIKMLHLKTKEDIYKFSLQYAANDPLDFSIKSYFQRNTKYVFSINWKKVKREYDGIFISPYQWNCRSARECFWYNGWDCSSGCVWNLDKVSMELSCLIDIESITEPFQEKETPTDSVQLGHTQLK